MYPSPPSPPNAPGRGIWWPRMVWTCIPLTWAHVLLSAVLKDHLEFSRVHPYPQYRYLVLKSGTTVGQHDIWSDCGSGWCLVRMYSPPPSPHYAPSMPPSHPQYRHLVAKSSTTSGQVDIWSAYGSGWLVYARVNLVPAAMVIPAHEWILKLLQLKSSFAIVFSFQ